jgi:predicted  nucleic acid-binding Zn-ribbon protein
VTTWASRGRKDNVLMRLADQYLLAQIREKLLSHIPDDQWRLVEEEVDKAGGVRRVGGYTGVLLTDAISKASFGGDHSAAGRYAALQRWKGHTKDDTSDSPRAQAAGAAPPPNPNGPSGRKAADARWAQGKAGSESARYKKLMERHRSIGRDIEYSKEQLNRTADMIRQATDDKTREQAKDAYSRLEKLVGNLRIKQEMVARMIRKEFPETVQGVLRDEKIRGDTQIVRSEPKGSAKFNSGKKMMLDSLRREFYPKVNAALAKDPEKIKANYEKEIQRKEKDLDRLRAGKTNFGEFNTLNPRKATIGKRIKEIERQIEGLKGELAGIDEYLDETSPGFFSS